MWALSTERRPTGCGTRRAALRLHRPPSPPRHILAPECSARDSGLGRVSIARPDHGDERSSAAPRPAPASIADVLAAPVRIRPVGPFFSFTADTGFCAAAGPVAVAAECRRLPTGAMRGDTPMFDSAPGDVDEPAVFGATLGIDGR